MANMNWERIKEQNGRVEATVPDLKVNDCILFEGEAEGSQGHIITDIYKPFPGAEHIIVQYMPEWTPVCNESAFKYGTMKFRQKYSKIIN